METPPNWSLHLVTTFFITGSHNDESLTTEDIKAFKMATGSGSLDVMFPFASLVIIE